MRKSLELRQKADAIYQKAKALLAKADVEKRELSDQDRADLDGMEAQVKGLKADAARYESIENHEAGRAENPDRPQPSGDEEEADDKPAKVAKVFPTMGHQLAAVYKATVNNDVESRNKLMAAASGASEAVDSEGGFAVQADFASGIEKRMHDVGTLFRLVNPINVAGNALVERFIDEQSRATGSRWGGVRGYWVDEAAAITDSKPKFDKRRTELQKVAALGYSTEELLEDFPAMSGIFEEAFTEELLFQVEDGIFEGDGAGKPLGFAHASSPSLIAAAKETGQAADTFTTGNISEMWNRFYSRGRANSYWLINQEVEPQLDQLTIIAGTAALEPRFVTYGPDGILRIKGRPVIVIEYASAIGDQGDVVLCDPTQYRFIRKGGVKQATSMHVKFTTDEMAFRSTYRCGGQSKWKSALTPFKATSGRTVSPFVTLAAR